MKKPKSPHTVDIHVGRRVKTRRVLREMSQTALADRLGLTFQQLQKYESGANRISASRLWHIAQVLNVPVVYFFEGIDGADATVDETVDAEALLFAQTAQSLPTKVRKQVQGLLSAVSKHLDTKTT